jgi:hypothetical protein
MEQWLIMANDANSDTYFPASRVGADTRVDVGFFGRGSSRLFGSVISPSGESLGGVVICPPLHADFSPACMTRRRGREGRSTGHA